MEEINPIKNPEEYQEKLLYLMKRYEILLGELYSEYAEKFPEYADFWNTISKEEGTHAYWIETLAGQIGSYKIFFNETRFNIAPLNICIDEVVKVIDDAKKEPISILEAMATSINIENGMIERNFFEVFESDSPEIKKTFNMLREATLGHEQRVKDMWAVERARSFKAELSHWQKIRNFFLRK
jgi:rubrerythrin